MISISITTGSGETRLFCFELTEGTVIRIGRDEMCEIALPEEIHVSRVHCIICYTNGQLIIQDNQSSNGIFLNEERVIADYLMMNAVYKMGSCTMFVMDEAYAPAQFSYPAQDPAAFALPPAAYPQASSYQQLSYFQPQQGYASPQCTIPCHSRAISSHRATPSW